MNENQKTVLMNAVMHSTLQSVKYHINRYKLVLEDEDFFDYELLKAALARGQLDIVSYLLKVGCRVRNPSKINLEETPLHLAVRLNNPRIINIVLKNGASIYDKNKNGETVIYVGFKEEYHNAIYTVFNFLCLYSDTDNRLKPLFHGFKNLDPMNNDDIRHFHIACILNHVKAVSQYLKFGFDVNSPFSLDSAEFSGLNLLHYAVKKSYFNLFELLLRHGGDLTIKNIDGQTPLQILYYSGCSALHMVALAFYCGNDTKFVNSADNNGVSHFHLCCTIHNSDAVKVFIDKGIDVNSSISLTCSIYPGFTPLHFAVMNNCHEVVELLLKNGADCRKADAKGTTPLHLACDKADPLLDVLGQKIIKILIDYKACPAAVNKKGFTPLHVAFYRDQHLTKIMDILISKIPRKVNFINEQGLSHFHIVCTSNDISRVNDFLESGVAVDSCVVSGVYSGYTALHFAVLFSQKDVVETLLKKNAQVNIKTSEFQLTPLHIACTLDKPVNLSLRKEIIKLLLVHKANVNAKTKNSTIPLQIAINNFVECSLNHEDIICALLEHGSDVNIRDESGKTLLQVAVEKRLIFVIEKLLYYGADINMEDSLDNSIVSSLAVQNFELFIQFDYRREYSIIFKIIFTHVQKLLALGLYVNEKIQTWCKQSHQQHYTVSTVIDDRIRHLIYFDDCIEELERMKLIKVDNYTSLYSILLKNTHELSKRVKNSNFIKILEDENTYINFPLYTFLLKVPFKKALIRSVVLESAYASLSSIIGLNLPEPCCDSILKHLTNEEIESLNTAILIKSNFKRKMYNDDNSSKIQTLTKLLKKEE